jgi:hypothetical protein
MGETVDEIPPAPQHEASIARQANVTSAERGVPAIMALGRDVGANDEAL